MKKLMWLDVGTSDSRRFLRIPVPWAMCVPTFGLMGDMEISEASLMIRTLKKCSSNESALCYMWSISRAHLSNGSVCESTLWLPTFDRGWVCLRFLKWGSHGSCFILSSRNSVCKEVDSPCLSFFKMFLFPSSTLRWLKEKYFKITGCNPWLIHSQESLPCFTTVFSSTWMFLAFLFFFKKKDKRDIRGLFLHSRVAG